MVAVVSIGSFEGSRFVRGGRYVVGELSAIPPGTDQKPVLESKLTQFEAKAKATAKKPVNFCIDVTL